MGWDTPGCGPVQSAAEPAHHWLGLGTGTRRQLSLGRGSC